MQMEKARPRIRLLSQRTHDLRLLILSAAAEEAAAPGA